MADHQGKAGDVRGDRCTKTRRRPEAETAYTNLVLAGDWTATGLPATIEGAIRSGRRAAKHIRDRSK